MTRRREWLLAGAISAAAPIVVLLVLELVLRAAGLRPDDYFTYARYFAEGYFPTGYFVRNPTRGFDIAPGAPEMPFNFGDTTVTVFANDLGCMDRETPAHLAAGDYVLLLGDSFTWGFAPYESKYGAVIANRTGLTIAKCGVADTGQRHQLGKGREVVAAIGHAPRLVVVGFYANDPEDDARFPNATVYRGHLVNLPNVDRLDDAALEAVLAPRYDAWVASTNSLRNRIRNTSVAASALWTAAQAVTRAMGAGPPREAQPAVPGDYLVGERSAANRTAIADIKAWTGSMGARLLFVLIPGLGMDASGYDQIAAFLAGQGIDYVNPLAEFLPAAAREELFWRFDSHLNVRGNEVLGDLLAPQVLRRW